MSTVVRTPPPSPGATSGIVSVEDYTKGFFAKVLRSGYSPDPTENIDKSGIVFNALLRKLERVADRADVAIPLRCLRDEITHLWVANGPGSPTATELTEVMFMLFDRVEWECRRNPMPRVTPTGPAPDVVAEELRARVYKCVVGDTWEPYVELKMMALRRMWRYVLNERAVAQRLEGNAAPASMMAAGRKPTAHGIGKRLSHKIVSMRKDSWEACFDDLVKASSAKLAPLLKEAMSALFIAEERLYLAEVAHRGRNARPAEAATQTQDGSTDAGGDGAEAGTGSDQHGEAKGPGGEPSGQGAQPYVNLVDILTGAPIAAAEQGQPSGTDGAAPQMAMVVHPTAATELGQAGSSAPGRASQDGAFAGLAAVAAGQWAAPGGALQPLTVAGHPIPAHYTLPAFQGPAGAWTAPGAHAVGTSQQGVPPASAGAAALAPDLRRVQLGASGEQHSKGNPFADSSEGEDSTASKDRRDKANLEPSPPEQHPHDQRGPGQGELRQQQQQQQQQHRSAEENWAAF